MPYNSRADLPESVRNSLPAHAQDIYKEDYNSDWEQYGHDEGRAHRVAWGGAEKKDQQSPCGKWVDRTTKDDR